MPKETATLTVEGTRKRGWRWRKEIEEDLNAYNVNKKGE
jgi:hypothetical protein